MENIKSLSSFDQEIFDLIEKETKRQEDEIELIASENYASPAVLEAMASSLNNKYSEGYPGKRYYGGNAIIDDVETLAIERLKKLFGAEHANVQALSGSPANAAVYMAFLEPGDKVLGLKLDHGGHLSHGHSVNFSGRLYNFVQYEVAENGVIDMEKVREVALKEKPKMIVAGFSAYSRDLDWKKFKEIADEVGAYTFADIAHIAGLIAGGCLSSPVPYFDVVSSTTHKTLRGPRGAFILCKEQFAKQIDRAIFPGMQGGPHDHITAAKAVAFKEALQPEFKIYCQQIIKNAKTMAEKFMELGYEIVSGGTDNHLMVIDLRNKNISGLEAEKALEKIGVSVSRSTIPNDPAPPMRPSGVRIGTPAITTRGFEEQEVLMATEFIDLALRNKDDEKVLSEIKEKIKELCSKFPIYKK
ncbi:serine hydroxymethyltransferase [Candidatus Falkowbacteria bacterium HGW-Falkowbacteria-1]|uniref:Serine hydroxymethyltransferase n=1 Tax=Candidatus Falkowbacteria bacterium HGW-Falkowbacteria-1 TaxID=2013768 RepID=A0A2N2E955_9BACT|nr:MAG: serine hydroxymethyltransferase [Candidatus Falkowbacteria bacterium HGW-Falkowbacteria-1]